MLTPNPRSCHTVYDLAAHFSATEGGNFGQYCCATNLEPDPLLAQTLRCPKMPDADTCRSRKHDELRPKAFALR
jgi:hypothetical protein